MGRNLFATFMDLKESYNRIDRNGIWGVLNIYGVERHIPVTDSIIVNGEPSEILGSMLMWEKGVWCPFDCPTFSLMIFQVPYWKWEIQNSPWLDLFADDSLGTKWRDAFRELWTSEQGYDREQTTNFADRVGAESMHDKSLQSGLGKGWSSLIWFNVSIGTLRKKVVNCTQGIDVLENYERKNCKLRGEVYYNIHTAQ